MGGDLGEGEVGEGEGVGVEGGMEGGRWGRVEVWKGGGRWVGRGTGGGTNSRPIKAEKCITNDLT